ncbi:uncharacterized protein LOC118280602 isoform X2 [Spodoptera frugiperda]|uniref:Nuclear protein MDM1 n=1 Tax=Spodoptera frugiperda TaxID=7108 RepID=A0A9R0DJM6_SPOFR|nr:uncharacterized protein LOC118280602 isoform X2 [Spodoptera frugiperda]XP_035456681.1 uncharacterized protein LOC118280602 isoform X2 [Spodoptera frugiperda]XP_035456682.1 uncharacterized protein LOC118280602 isoform X2 [Spodoptera frugiperda]
MERSVLAESRHVQWASELHSEYRSTYKWHEYKEQQQQGVVKQPAPTPPSALPIQRGPMEPAMPRRKKYPGVAYKTNELFDPAPADDIRPQQTSAFDRARSAQRNDADRAGRRSKSEGPRQPRWTDTVEPKATTALGEVMAAKEPEIVSTEYRNQFAWPKDTTDAPRKSISMGALKKAAVAEGLVEAEPLMNHVDGDHDDHKRYIEDYLWNGQKPGVQRKSTFRNALSALISNGEDRSKDNRKRYKSEYKKKFRPFSQYVYEASKGTFTKCRGKGKANEEASERMLGDAGQGVSGASAGQGTGAGGVAGVGDAGEDSANTLRAAGLQPLGLAQGDSWYREVLDLRKRAGEYKYRGWGTEMAPEHITQLYNKQIELWYQVSRRSSLSALSLASTNHKALPRDEKDGKESKGHSPKKFRSFRSAPHQSIHAKLQETKALERSPHKTSPQKQRKKLQGHSFDEGATQDGAKGENAAFRSPRRRPRSADPAPAAAHVKLLANGHEPHPAPIKPTGLQLSRGSSNRVRSTSRGGRSPSAPSKTGAGATGATGATGANGAPGRGRRSRSVSKVGIKLDDEIPSHRSASVAKDHFFDDSPVVKSPPEPTRVKSPEQMNMRSPDPVNWTVPLDTGKTFTVTQNVKSDESIKRPSSEFKGGSVAEEATVKPAEIAPIHHQQMSPIRSLKKSESPTSLSKRTDKTPTTPISLTPIDETKALDMNKVNGINGVNGVNGVNSNELTPETPTQEPIQEKELIKKSTEATQIAPGVVDTNVVNEAPATGGLTASEILDRARTRFDKFWGKKEEDNV